MKLCRAATEEDLARTDSFQGFHKYDQAKNLLNSYDNNGDDNVGSVAMLVEKGEYRASPTE